MTTTNHHPDGRHTATQRTHPLATRIPAMSDDDYQTLRNDIATNGQLEPIVTLDNLILDGRHRYAACLDLNITPDTRPYTGTSPASYVVSENLHRRHLTVGQRAMLAADLLPTLEAEAEQRRLNALNPDRATPPEPHTNPGRARDHAADHVGISPRSVAQAKRVLAHNPDLADHVRAGHITLNQAERTVTREQDAAATAAIQRLAATPDPAHRALTRAIAACLHLNHHPTAETIADAYQPQLTEAIAILTRLLR